MALNCGLDDKQGKKRENNLAKVKDLIVKASSYIEEYTDKVVSKEEATEMFTGLIEMVENLDYTLADVDANLDLEREVQRKINNIIKTSKILGSEEYNDISRQSAFIFEDIQNYISNPSNTNFNVKLDYQMKRLAGSIQEVRNKWLKKMDSYKEGVNYDAFTLADTLSKEETLEFLEILRTTPELDINFRELSPAHQMLYKLNQETRSFIKNNLPEMSTEEFEMAVLSGNFDASQLMGLRGGDSKLSKYYDFMYGDNRMNLSMDEENAAKKEFVKIASGMVENKDVEKIEELFYMLVNLNDNIDGRDPTASRSRSLLSSYNKLKTIKEKLGTNFSDEELSNIAKLYQKDANSMLSHHSNVISKFGILKKEFGTSPSKTFADVSTLAKSIIGSGDKLGEFNSKLNLLNDLVDVSFFPSRTDSIDGLFNEIIFKQITPLLKGMVLFGSSVKHIYEPVSVTIKQHALEGKVSYKESAKTMLAAMAEIEGVAARGLGKGVDKLTFNKYTELLENITKKLDFSQISKMTVENQMKLLEAVGSHIGSFNTFAGVIDTGRAKKGEGFMSKSSDILSNFNGLESLDQASNFLSYKVASTMLDGILNSKIKDLPKPIIKLLKSYGLTDTQLEVFKISQDKSIENKKVKAKMMNDLIEKDFKIESYDDITKKDLSRYFNYLANKEIKKVADFDKKGSLKRNDANNKFLDDFAEKLNKGKEEHMKIDMTDFKITKNSNTNKIEVIYIGTNSKIKSETESMQRFVSEELNKSFDNLRDKITSENKQKFYDSKANNDTKELEKIKKFSNFNNNKTSFKSRTQEGDIDYEKINIIKKKMVGLQGELFRVLSTPKPNKELNLALRKINENADEMSTAVNVINSTLTFMSSKLSAIYQAKQTLSTFKEHLETDEGKVKANMANMKLISSMTSHTILISLFSGLMNSLGSALLGKEDQLNAMGIAKNSMQLSIISNAINGYGSKYGGSVTGPHIASLMEGNPYSVLKLMAKNPMIYNAFTTDIYDAIPSSPLKHFQK